MVALRAIVAKLRNRKFTVAEAAAMTGISVQQVNNLLDEIVPLGLAHAGNRKRELEYRGLFILPLACDLAKAEIPPNLRKKALQAALESPKNKHITITGTNLLVRIDNYRVQVSYGLTQLYLAEESVSSSPEIMQGEPCIRGTRIPVYVVAKLANVHGAEEALATYSTLSKQQVADAQLFAVAKPRRGAPKKIALPVAGHKVPKVFRRKK